MAEDAGEAQEDAGVERHLLVDAVDVGAVAAQFARQPDAGAVLLVQDVADSVADVHGSCASCAAPLVRLDYGGVGMKKRGEPSRIILLLGSRIPQHKDNVYFGLPTLYVSARQD